MKRGKAIKALQEIGSDLAMEYGYTEMVIGEDRQKGIWGESLTKALEKEYGECTKDITWIKESCEKSCEEYIQYRFRFANPCLAIHKKGGAFAEIELSDFNSENKERNGNFKFSQGMIWKEEGIELFTILKERWDNAVLQDEQAE